MRGSTGAARTRAAGAGRRAARARWSCPRRGHGPTARHGRTCDAYRSPEDRGYADGSLGRLERLAVGEHAGASRQRVSFTEASGTVFDLDPSRPIGLLLLHLGHPLEDVVKAPLLDLVGRLGP